MKARVYPHVVSALEERKLQFVVILGHQRSGSSLLAAMLGKHPDVGMLYEAYTFDFFKLYGKPIAANKLLVPHQIHHSRKGKASSRILAFIISRIPLLNRWFRMKYFIPNTHYSLEDLKSIGARFIVLQRDRDKIISSMIRRAGYTREQAEREHAMGLKTLAHVKGHDVFQVRFEELLARPEAVSKEICSWLGIPFSPNMLEGPETNIRYPEGDRFSERG